MNGIAFESGAGTSLLSGPVLNPTGATGAAALQLAQTWFLHMAGESNATNRFVTADFSALNLLGWPGLWPTLQPFSSWNPEIHPTHDTGCSISSDDDPGLKRALVSDNYECDYSMLHLPDRDTAVSMTIGPGSSGWTDWKEALWTLNYLQVMHGGHEDAVTSVPASRLGDVGIPGNDVVGGVVPGTYLGSSDIEGFQAGNFIQILDNQAAQNQVPDGEPTLHDRALAMLRVVVVDMDRLHAEPATDLLADDADVSSAASASPSRGTLLSSDVAAYTLLALRTARRALDSALGLYSNTTPDTAGIPSPLDDFPPLAGVPFGQRLDQLIGALADVFYDKLTTADGHAFAGWDAAQSAPTDDGTTLDAHTAALRGLLVASRDRSHQVS
jgi:hypothetical protein